MQELACNRYEDQGRVRPIMHRASLVEIIVPYGDPRHPFEKKCAYDIVDYGLGFTANSLELGCDCLGSIQYFDAVLNNSKGARASPCMACGCELLPQAGRLESIWPDRGRQCHLLHETAFCTLGPATVGHQDTFVVVIQAVQTGAPCRHTFLYKQLTCHRGS